MSRMLSVSRELTFLERAFKTNGTSEIFRLAESRSFRWSLSTRVAPRKLAGTNLKISRTTFISLVLIALNVGLGFNYLAGVNTYASKGYEIKRLQSNLARQQEEVKKLTLKVAETNSIAQVQEALSRHNFVPVTGTLFVRDFHLSQR